MEANLPLKVLTRVDTLGSSLPRRPSEGPWEEALKEGRGHSVNAPGRLARGQSEGQQQPRCVLRERQGGGPGEAPATALPGCPRGGGRTRNWGPVFSRPANTHSPDFCQHGRRAKVSASGKTEQSARRLLGAGTRRPQHDSRLLAGDLAAKPTSWPAPPAHQGLGGGCGLSSWRAHRTCLPSETSAGTSGSC